MNDLRTAAQQALEALEFDGFTPEDATHRYYTTKAITALRAALAEPVQEWASIPGTNVRVRLPHRPHDAGSHNQQMTPAVQRVVDAADKRARNKAAIPANCTTPTDCRSHGCHGDCLPAAISTEQAEPVQEPVAHLWQHSETGRTRVVMPDQVITADATWFVVGPLYLAPPQRKPLTEEELTGLMAQTWGDASIAPQSASAFARAIEQAHGIKS